ncbi:bifunctional protein-serine/threonine kinase/phosphatase [Bermanella marisrubri]|uniref:Protein kinase:Protein phosphatase 2C-like protein n=1 Tax=Bermanella marisrubri TaxID=207949 RepID=Q1N3N1_9GAMM|nr:bifunctional protein-serine/threonine kinase/phosphatase [Bermanella marisrubri]EAT12843.1 Protein kinase:Protein phosphatase 2C-like protein [Oceanobacter sp. RED65] [Bermanella marisrubri]QIZ83164.1 bifunctional protein-serine/threonine kinase/phosphatase [Bermanella marisrubri]
MTMDIKAEFAQLSEKGEHAINQDAIGYCSPVGFLEKNKGHIAIVADGISTSPYSHIASQVLIRSLLEDYYSTPDIWTVKNSIFRVLSATNQWLYSQSRLQSNENRGYIASFACAIAKGHFLHVFHAGDCRVYRLRDDDISCLTEDHRYWPNPDTHLLSRAMGLHKHLELDYRCIELKENDIYLLSTDGIHDSIPTDTIRSCLTDHHHSLKQQANALLKSACIPKNHDDKSLVVFKIETINISHNQQQALPIPPLLEQHKQFDGHRILKKLYSSDRSHLYLVESNLQDAPYVLKAPAQSQSDEADFLDEFMHEEWVAKRLNHKNIVQCLHYPKKQYHYILSPYIDGQTLKQYMDDFGPLALYETRQITLQLASALQSIHRKEMVHRDVRPSNIMLDRSKHLTLIDLASCQVTSLQENAYPDTSIKGTLAYTAPEIFLYERATPASDIFSLGVIIYEMLTGKLPYGHRVNQISRARDLNKLSYTSVKIHDPRLPKWLDRILRKALHPKVQHRYQEVSELVYDLQHSRAETEDPISLADAHPVRFWQGLSALLAAGLLWTLYLLQQL